MTPEERITALENMFSVLLDEVQTMQRAVADYHAADAKAHTTIRKRLAKLTRGIEQLRDAVDDLQIGDDSDWWKQ